MAPVTSPNSRAITRRAIQMLLLVLGALLVPASPAAAALDVVGFSGSVVRADGAPEQQAGAHPYAATTTIDFASHIGPDGFSVLPDESLKDLRVTLPPGFVGDPTATPRCPEADFNDLKSGGPACPASTQVGIVYLKTSLTGGYTQFFPVYNVVPPPGVPAVFGFNLSANTVRLVASVRTGQDYGLTIAVDNASQYLGLLGTRLTFWGVPADPSHDPQRFSINQIPGVTSDAPLRPFLTNPVDCSAGPLTTGLSAASWESPAVFDTASFDHDVDGVPLEVVGCDRVPFDPSITARPVETGAGSPTGLAVRVSVPQNGNPAAISSASLRKAVVRLPLGTAVSASSADGLGACSPAQIALDTAAPDSCPAASRIGSVTIDTPLLDEPLHGSVHLARQADNPFNSLLALYITASGSGVVVKLPGRVDADPVTGQLTATFDNNPQLPFDSLAIDFDGGARAPLVNPKTCGLHTTSSELTSWSGKTVSLTDSFVIDRGCDSAGRFEPTLVAGTTDPRAGRSAPFTLTIARPSGQQDLSGLDVSLPRGLLGRIGDVPLCPDALAAAGTCGEQSRVGRVISAAGPGSRPLYVPQPGKAATAVYLGGPYRGAPFSLAVVVPAQAGPFDLGTIVVRVALFVDRDDAHVSVASDAIPTIVQGIPLEIQQLNVTLDRAGFMVNPTSCAAARIDATVRSSAGARVGLSNRFQVGDCASLPFRPSVSLTVGRRGRLTRGKRTPLVVTVNMPAGNANNRSVEVTLPKAINARLDVVNRRRACSIEQFRADRCPMVVGSATAVTPLLRDPIAGPAYFVYNPARRLPDLVVRLKGQVNVDLVGKVRITRDLRLQTTFDAVPDAPISRFRLTLASGPRNGPVGLTQAICEPANRRKLAAEIRLVAQSGRLVERAQRIAVAGCGRRSARTRSVPARDGRRARRR